MSKLTFNDVELNIPSDWQDQGMVTFTLPSTDKDVKPNIIVTKERLAKPTTLADYFERLKQSIQKRGIQDFEILDEKDIIVAGEKAKVMLCTWDVSAMKKNLAEQGGYPADEVKAGQVVKQVQVTVLKGQMAFNMTGSFPDTMFDQYYKPFQQLLKSLKFL